MEDLVIDVVEQLKLKWITGSIDWLDAVKRVVQEPGIDIDTAAVSVSGRFSNMNNSYFFDIDIINDIILILMLLTLMSILHWYEWYYTDVDTIG